MRTFMVEFKQKEKLGTFLQAKTGFGRRKGRGTIHLFHFTQKHLERKREKVEKERKGRKKKKRKKEKKRKKKIGKRDSISIS